MAQPIILSFASGKGGVGKSVTSASIAAALAKLGKKVLIIDADFGGANLHTYFGVKLSSPSLTDYLQGRVTKLSEVVLQTKIPNLWLICGHNARFDMANISHETKMTFLSQLPKAPVEYVIVDTGAGSSYQTIDAFLCGNFKIAISTPSRPSIENMIHFLKATAYRKIRISLYTMNALKLITPELEFALSGGVLSIREFVKRIYDVNPMIGTELVRELKTSNFGILLNKAQSEVDKETPQEIAKFLHTIFGWPIRNLGHLSLDPYVELAERTCSIPTMHEQLNPYSTDVFVLAKILSDLTPSTQ